MFRYLFLSMLVVMLFACTRQEAKREVVYTPFLQEEATWADSMVFSMSLDEKIGQLFLFQPSIKDSLQRDSLIRLAQENRLGGVILEGLDLVNYFELIDSMQGLSRFPLFNASRLQVSFNNQFSDLTRFPNAATISAINDDTLKKAISNLSKYCTYRS